MDGGAVLRGVRIAPTVRSRNCVLHALRQVKNARSITLVFIGTGGSHGRGQHGCGRRVARDGTEYRAADFAPLPVVGAGSQFWVFAKGPRNRGSYFAASAGAASDGRWVGAAR